MRSELGIRDGRDGKPCDEGSTRVASILEAAKIQRKGRWDSGRRQLVDVGGEDMFR